MSASRVTAVLLAITAAIACIGPLIESGGRSAETVARSYLASVEREDLNGALETLAPELRPALRGRVELQLGTRYEVQALVLGGPSALDRLRGWSADRAWVGLAARVTPVSGERWSSTGVVALVRRDDQWYLADPPFA
jgi:hypothetical protein